MARKPTKVVLDLNVLEKLIRRKEKGDGERLREKENEERYDVWEGAGCSHLTMSEFC